LFVFLKLIVCVRALVQQLDTDLQLFIELTCYCTVSYWM